MRAAWTGSTYVFFVLSGKYKLPTAKNRLQHRKKRTCSTNRAKKSVTLPPEVWAISPGTYTSKPQYNEKNTLPTRLLCQRTVPYGPSP